MEKVDTSGKALVEGSTANEQRLPRKKAKTLKQRVARGRAVDSLSDDFLPTVAEVVLTDLLARLANNQLEGNMETKMALAQQLKTVSLLYCVNKVTMATIRQVYKGATRALRQQAAVRQACYDALMVGVQARWQRTNPGRTPSPHDQQDWPVRPLCYADPLDTLFSVLIVNNHMVRQSVLPDLGEYAWKTSGPHILCKPFDAACAEHGGLWVAARNSNAGNTLNIITGSNPPNERTDMFQWIQERVNNTCNVCKRVTKDYGLGGNTIGRVCKPCKAGMFVEISTLCTQFGIYNNGANGVYFRKLRLSHKFNDMSVQQVRLIDPRASMLQIPAVSKRRVQFVDMRSVFRAVSTADDPTGEVSNFTNFNSTNFYLFH